MSPLAPDLFTAVGMTAVAALLLAGVVHVQTAAPSSASVRFAVVHHVLFATACITWAWHLQVQDAASVLVIALLLLSAALANLTIAVQRLQACAHHRREIITAALPITALLLVAAWDYFFASSWLHSTFACILALQSVYLAVCIVRMRQALPGHGWKILASSAGFYALTVGLATYALSGLNVEDAGLSERSASAPLLWLLCMLPMLMQAMACFGYLRLLHDRDHAAEQGLSQLDALTQLPNRAALVPHLQQAIEHAATQGEPLAVMVLDIDHFKSVNDSYGHLVGDHVIQRIGRTLMQQARIGDFSARYGGEEFVVVLPNTTARDAFHLAERLCKAVRKSPMPLPSGKLLHITVSVGVYAGQPTHGNAWERLVAAADEAMYVAKRSGRDRVAMSAAIQAVQATSTATV